jgi:hypothetical protein
MSQAGSARAASALIDPSDPEGRRTAFEALLRSPRFEEHRRKLRAEVEHWPPRTGPVPPDSAVKERSDSEELAFRREISRNVLDSVLYHCSLYYRAFLPEGDAGVRRGRAGIVAAAKNAATLCGELATAMNQLWRSGDPAVRRILDPLAAQYPRGDDLPASLNMLKGAQKKGFLSEVEVARLADPGFVAFLEEMRRGVELIATALPGDVGGRRRSVLFEKLVLWLEGIYSEITGEPAYASARAGVPEGRFFHFAKAVVAWLRAAASELPDVTFDLPPTDDALRMTMHRLSKRTEPPA